MNRRKHALLLLGLIFAYKQAFALEATPKYIALFQDVRSATLQIRTQEPVVVTKIELTGRNISAFSVTVPPASKGSGTNTGATTEQGITVTAGHTLDLTIGFLAKSEDKKAIRYEALLRIEGYNTQATPPLPVVLEVPIYAVTLSQKQDIACEVDTRYVYSHPAAAPMPPLAWSCKSNSGAPFQFTEATLKCDAKVPVGLFAPSRDVTKRTFATKQEVRFGLTLSVPPLLPAATYGCTLHLRDDRGGEHQARQVVSHSKQPAHLWCQDGSNPNPNEGFSLITGKQPLFFDVMAPKETQQKRLCKLVLLDLFRIQTWDLVLSNSDFSVCKDEPATDAKQDNVGAKTPLVRLCFTPQHRGRSHRAEAALSYMYTRVGDQTVQKATLRIPVQGSTAFATRRQKKIALSTCDGSGMVSLLSERDAERWTPLDVSVEGPDSTQFNVDLRGTKLSFGSTDESLSGTIYRATVKLWLTDKNDPSVPSELRIFPVDGKIEVPETCSERAKPLKSN